MANRCLMIAAACLTVCCLACGGGERVGDLGGTVSPPGSEPQAGASPDDGTGLAETAGLRSSAARETSSGSPGSADGAAPTPVSSAVPQKQFPPQDYLNKILAAYEVANSYPELLTGIPCYCPCMLYGHGGVIDCYRSQHAAMCQVCLDEAVLAGNLYRAQLNRGEDDPRPVRAAVKEQYRGAIASNTYRELPMANLASARSYVQVCSDCHQPPQPAMHSPQDWGTSLQRMEGYARQSGQMPPQQAWDAAVQYVRSVSGQYPPDTFQQVQDSLKQTIDRLQTDEGDSAYYPSRRDDVLGLAGFERMVEAYRIAGELPSDVLESAPAVGSNCQELGHDSLLGCLNSWHAITCEETVERVHALAAQHRDGE